MAKSRLGLKETIGLSPKQNIKKSVVDIDKTEKAVKEIHSAGKKDLTRMSIDIDKDLFIKMKMKLVPEGMTVRDYVLSLIEKDLSK